MKMFYFINHVYRLSIKFSKNICTGSVFIIVDNVVRVNNFSYFYILFNTFMIKTNVCARNCKLEVNKASLIKGKGNV